MALAVALIRLMIACFFFPGVIGASGTSRSRTTWTLGPGTRSTSWKRVPPSPMRRRNPAEEPPASLHLHRRPSLFQRLSAALRVEEGELPRPQHAIRGQACSKVAGCPVIGQVAFDEQDLPSNVPRLQRPVSPTRWAGEPDHFKFGQQ